MTGNVLVNVRVELNESWVDSRIYTLNNIDQSPAIHRILRLRLSDDRA